MRARSTAAGLVAVALWTAACSFPAVPEGGVYERGAAPPDSKAWDLLREMIAIPGVSGHEAAVADFVAAALPEGVEAKRDAMHNVWFTAGSGGLHLMFVAHTDELGWTVAEITASGRVLLRGTAGFLAPTIEGSPVVIHAAGGPVLGVVVPRPAAEPAAEARAPAAAPDQRPVPEIFEVDLGVESAAAAAALGVSVGDPVTFRKTIIDLAPGALAARAVDDRAGCAALLDIAGRFDWSKLQGKTVTFAWDVQEETGLIGASALAREMRPDYVFPVDTFVSTDSPLESRRLAYARLGYGAVIRAIDSSSIAPQTEIRKILDLAARRGIPIQAANTRGGNDGSVFQAGGAVCIPLSWPGVYSHSRIEKIDRRDLEALTELILALVEDWPPLRQ